MPYDLAISPSEHLYAHLFPDEGGQETGIQNEKIIQAFERSSAEGLFALAVAEDCGLTLVIGRIRAIHPF